jgi:tetratricopeptide (TPR) repeat protein
VTRLAKAWEEIDRTAFKSAVAPLDAARQIDPADSRVPAFQAALATAQKNYQEAIYWYQMGAAMEEAEAQLSGRSLFGKSAIAVRADDSSLALLMNLRCAGRYKDLNQPDQELAVLQRSLDIEPKLLPAALHVASDHVVMPNIIDPTATSARPLIYYLAWTHVHAGYALLDAGKTDDALKQFNIVKSWSKEPAVSEARQLAYAAALRLSIAKGNPSQKKKWMAAAKKEEPLSDDEVQEVDQSLQKERYNNQQNWNAQQMADFQAKEMELMDMRQKMNTPGGYDFRNNPNYQGTDDIGPDDVHMDVPNNANAVLRRGAGDGEQRQRNPEAAQ